MAQESAKTGRRRGTRAEHVVRQVRNYIFTNGLKPGDRIPGEHDLARVLNVSQPTLREAIKGLSVSGLLESRPRIGTRVRAFTYDQVVDTLVAHFHLSNLELREILEASGDRLLANMVGLLQAFFAHPRLNGSGIQSWTRLVDHGGWMARLLGVVGRPRGRDGRPAGCVVLDQPRHARVGIPQSGRTEPMTAGV